MSISVSIPTNLRTLTNDADTVAVEAGDIGQLIDALEAKFPGMKERLLDPQGELRRFVLVHLNGEDVRYLDGKKTALKANDEVSITPAVAGG